MPRRQFRRELLDRMDRALLARLLAPHAAQLAAIDIDLTALAASAQHDRAHVRRLYDAAHTDRIPAVVRDLFTTLNPIATPSGQAEILRLDAASPAPRFLGSSLAPCDLAATVYLDAPEIFRAVRIAADAEGDGAFTDFAAKDARPLVVEHEAVARLEAALLAWLEARGRKQFCAVHVTETAEETLFEIEYACPADAWDFVDERLGLKQVNGVTTARAIVAFDKASCRVGVQGALVVKDVLRRLFGECFFGDAQHFTSAAAYDLEPLRDLDTALATHDVPGLVAIELREMWLSGAGDAWKAYGVGRGDLRRGEDAEELKSALARGGRIDEARLVLRVEGRARPTTLTLSPNRNKYLRHAPEVERVVHELLLLRGIMRLPSRGEREAAAE